MAIQWEVQGKLIDDAPSSIIINIVVYYEDNCGLFKWRMEMCVWEVAEWR